MGQKNPNSTSAQRFNSIVLELQALGRRQPLQQDDYQRAIEIMSYLRRNGFTNADVSDLSGGKWQEATVKKYTRGVIVQDSSFRDDAISYLLRMVAMNLTLDDLKQFISLNVAVVGKGTDINFRDIALLVDECKREQLSIKDLLQLYRQLQGRGRDHESVVVSISQLKEIFSYKVELDKLGITKNDFEQIVGVAKQYGQDVPAIIEAINKYGHLAAILDETKNKQAQCNELDAKINALEKQIADLEVQKNNLAAPLEIFNDLLKPNGYNEMVLVKIANAANKHQVDIKSVVEAINDYIGLAGIKRELEGLQAKKVNLEADLKTTEAKNAHLQTLLDMCDILLRKLKFSVSAIEDLVNVAKAYGEYVEVLHALAKYGKIKKIEEELALRENEKSQLEAEVSELKKKAASSRRPSRPSF